MTLLNMSYTYRNLLSSEEVKYKASLHWIIYVPAILWLVLGFIFEEAGIAWVFVAVALFSFGRAILRKLGSEFVLTNKRVVLRQGIISRKTVEVLLAKCEGISVNQGILGRILGFGTLVVTTGGATSRFDFVKRPVEFRNRVNAEIDAFYSRHERY